MSNALKCDNCGKYGDSPTAAIYVNDRDPARGLPEAWVEVAVRTPKGPLASMMDSRAGGGEFCSYECVAAWFMSNADSMRVASGICRCRDGCSTPEKCDRDGKKCAR